MAVRRPAPNGTVATSPLKALKAHITRGGPNWTSTMNAAWLWILALLGNSSDNRSQELHCFLQELAVHHQFAVDIHTTQTVVRLSASKYRSCEVDENKA